MAQRRVHNRFVRIYDPVLAPRLRAFDGVPCTTCGLPVLVRGDRDASGRWFHLDCTVPPDDDTTATYLLLHDTAEAGKDIDEMMDQIDEAGLASRVAAYRDGWLLAVERVRKQQKLRRSQLKR